MTELKTQTHPTEIKLADFLDKKLPEIERRLLEEHIASCNQCLEAVVSSYESVKEFKSRSNKGKDNIMKKINFYLVAAIIAFSLSFIMPRFFIQMLVATLLLGIKWVVDSKSTKMLIMIYEAWKKGGSAEATRILETLESGTKKRF